jgi:hypothetical protein
VGAGLALIGTGIAVLAVWSERSDRAALAAELDALLAADGAARVDADVAVWKRVLAPVDTEARVTVR